jgi:hypothetical protein
MFCKARHELFEGALKHRADIVTFLKDTEHFAGSL